MNFKCLLILILLGNLQLFSDNVGEALDVSPEALYKRVVAEGKEPVVLEERILDGVKGYCFSYEPGTVEMKSERRKLWLYIPMGNAFYLDKLNYGLVFFQGGGLLHHKPLLEGFEDHLYEALKSGIYVFHIDYSVGAGDLLYPMHIREWLMALTFIKDNFNLEHVAMAGESAGAEACSMLFSRYNMSDYRVHHINGTKVRGYAPVMMDGDAHYQGEEMVLILKDKEREKPYIRAISVLAMPSDMTGLDPNEFNFEPYFGVERPSDELMQKCSSLTYYTEDNRVLEQEGLEMQAYHGTEDELVPVEIARAFRDRMYELGFPIIYTEYKANHVMDGDYDKGDVVHMGQFGFLRRKILPEFRHQSYRLEVSRSKTLIYEYLNVRIHGIDFKGKVRIYRYNSRGVVCVFSGYLQNNYFDDSYINQQLEDETGYIISKVHIIDGKEVESRY